VPAIAAVTPRADGPPALEPSLRERSAVIDEARAGWSSLVAPTQDPSSNRLLERVEAPVHARLPLAIELGFEFADIPR